MLVVTAYAYNPSTKQVPGQPGLLNCSTEKPCLDKPKRILIRSLTVSYIYFFGHTSTPPSSLVSFHYLEAFQNENYILYSFIFSIGSHSVALTSLELAMENMLGSQSPSCIYLLGRKNKGVHTMPSCILNFWPLSHCFSPSAENPIVSFTIFIVLNEQQ